MVSVSVRAIFSSVVSAAAGTASATASTAAISVFMRVLLWSLIPPDGRPANLVGEDLGQELPGPVRAGRGEEGLRVLDLDDAAAVHEDHPVGDPSGEAHLVGDDHHGH